MDRCRAKNPKKDSDLNISFVTEDIQTKLGQHLKHVPMVPHAKFGADTSIIEGAMGLGALHRSISQVRLGSSTVSQKPQTLEVHSCQSIGPNGTKIGMHQDWGTLYTITKFHSNIFTTARVIDLGAVFGGGK